MKKSDSQHDNDYNFTSKFVITRITIYINDESHKKHMIKNHLLHKLDCFDYKYARKWTLSVLKKKKILLYKKNYQHKYF